MAMPGSAAPKNFADWIAAVMDRLILDPPAPPGGEGLAYDGTASGARPAEDRFALCFGAQWLDQWKGANACTLVSAGGGVGSSETGNALKTIQTGGDRRAIFSLRWSIEVHVWGRDAASDVTGRARDVERLREAIQIFENVSRVLHLFASGYGRWEEFSGPDIETPVNRYGESIVARFSVPCAVYDYKRTRIETPQVLTPATGQPVVIHPGEDS